jgi:hypothetical protein
MPKAKGGYSRLNIYLDDPNLRTQVKVAAARRGVTVSAYCLEAIRQRIASEGQANPSDEELERRLAASRSLDNLREKIGPIGVPVSELIREGRRWE